MEIIIGDALVVKGNRAKKYKNFIYHVASFNTEIESGVRLFCFETHEIITLRKKYVENNFKKLKEK